MSTRLALSLLLALSATAAIADIPFIEDNYPQAIARARTKNLPVFVETWAPW